MNVFEGVNRGLKIVTDLTISGSGTKVGIELRKPLPPRRVKFLEIREKHGEAFFIQR